MTMIFRIGLLLGAAALSACGTGTDTPGNSAGATVNMLAANDAAPAPLGNAADEGVGVPALAISGEGLALVDAKSGRTRQIPFGTAEADVIAAVASVRGAPAERGLSEECGAGPIGYVNFKDGPTLQLQDGKFVGWIARKSTPPLTTISGIGVGSTRHDLSEAYALMAVSNSTLGVEFEAAGLSGLFDGESPNARITDLWAGVTCVMR